MTKKQRELLNFIDQFIRQHGYAPSYREVMSSLDYRSVSTVATHVNNLIILGYLKKRDNSARSLEVVGVEEVSLKQTSVTSTQQKWLIDIISKKFQDLDENTKPSQQQIDEVFVLVGALKVLGFKEAALTFAKRLKDYQS